MAQGNPGSAGHFDPGINFVFHMKPPVHLSPNPKLTLVGAGPGDPELITLKGIRAIGMAQVILYDALVSEALLEYGQPDALKIFVGKRKDQITYTQQEIDRLIVHYAIHFGHVVRLKGGDSFVFGRGYEEIEYATRHGIAVEVIPGITSAVAVPELQHIPLTLRGITESFWVTTATVAGGAMSEDLQLAARSTATVIVLMGLHKLKEITFLYQSLGKAAIPVAVIQHGSLPREKIVIGTMDSIVEKVEAGRLSAPALIIIGEVVRLSGKKTLAAIGKHQFI